MLPRVWFHFVGMWGAKRPGWLTGALKSAYKAPSKAAAYWYHPSTDQKYLLEYVKVRTDPMPK